MSNLLDSASIVLTPTAYDNGKMLSVKPSVALGPELVTNGDFATDSDWNKGAGWTISGGKANFNTTGNSSLVQNLSITSGKKYRIQITGEITSGALKLTGGSGLGNDAVFTLPLDVTYTHDGGNNQIEIRAIGASVGYLDNVSVKEDLSGDFDFSRNSAATRVNAQGLVENVQILSGDLVSNGDFSQEGVQEVLNGSFSQEGSEVSSDVNFDNPSNWSLTGQSTVSNGVAHILQDDTSNTGVIANTTITNKTYRITGVVSDYVSGSVGFSSIGSTSPREAIPSQNGEFTIYYTSTRSTPSAWNIQRISSPCNLKIDNVSVKEVGQDWTLGTGWSIGEDKAIFDGGSDSNLVSYTNVDNGKSYKYSFTISNMTNGALSFRLGSSSSNDLRITTDGTYTGYALSDGTSIVFRAESGFDGSVTNISVKEVGQDWTFVNSNISIDNNGLEIISQGGNRPQANQIISGFTIGNKYKLSAIAKRGTCVSGVEIEISGIGSTVATNKNNTTEFANIFYEFIANSTSHTIQAKIDDGASATGETAFFKSVSVIEITDDTNLPRINYEGFSYQDVLGNELLTNGDFATDSDWSKTLGWSISSGTANCDGSQTGNTYLTSQSENAVIGKTYIISFTTLNITSGWVRARVGGINTSDLISTNGQYTYTVNATASTDICRVQGSVDFIGSIDNVSVKEYLGQEVVPDSGCGSWLLEPQSTNLNPYSEFTSLSLVANITKTNNYRESPSGVNNATRLQFTANGYASNNTQGFTTQYTLSCYAKRNDSGTQSVGFFTNGTGAVDSAWSLTSEWQRFTYTYTSTNTSYVGVAGLSGADVSIFGFQMEQQSYATSYIPTNGAASTRLQDIANNSGNATLINSTEGVLYAEIAALDNAGGKWIALSNGTTNERLSIAFQADYIRLYIRNTSGLIWDYTYTSANIFNYNKIALKYKSGDYALWINKVEVATDSNSNLPSGLNSLQFDSGSGGSNFYGNVKALVVYKEALTDEQLTCLTTI